MKASMPMMTRADVAAFSPKTYDPDARTVEVTWTTGARVRRRDWDEGEFDEELVVSEEAVDMTRLLSGRAPLLSCHNSYDLGDVLGVVESAWILGPNGRKEGRAKVRFSQRADIEPILTDVRDGILSSISVGYRVSQWEKIQAKGDAVPVMRAIRWEPYELSLVPLPADSAARVRTASGEVFECEVTDTTKEIEMVDDTVAEAAALATADATETTETVEERAADPVIETRVVAPVLDDAALRASVRAEEQARCAGILLTARKLGLDVKHAEKLIADGVKLDAARAKLIDLAADAQEGRKVNPVVTITRDEGETKARVIEDTIHYRAGNVKKPTDAVIEGGYQHLSLVDLARECLEFGGVKTRGMSPLQIAAMALQPGELRMTKMFTRIGGLHTTSDFANILSSTIGSTLRNAYGNYPGTFKQWARSATVPDFRAVSRVTLSGAPRLSSVNEHGEFTRGTMTDGKESYQVVTYGKIIGITRQVIVNDYLDAFSRIPSAMAQAAASLESDIVYKVLLANANMADGVALFHSTHANTGTAAVISVASLGEAFGLLAVQADSNNGSPMNLTARYLLVPPLVAPTAYQVTQGAVNANISTSVVPDNMRALIPVMEPRLATGVTVDGTTTSGDTNGWYVMADSSQIDTVEYAYLQGQEGVYTETKNGFDVDGVEIKVRLDFGAKAIDYRGMVSNAGA